MKNLLIFVVLLSIVFSFYLYSSEECDEVIYYYEKRLDLKIPWVGIDIAKVYLRLDQPDRVIGVLRKSRNSNFIQNKYIKI